MHNEDITTTTTDLQIVNQNLDWWGQRWAEGRSGWHMNIVNPHLLRHFELLTNLKVNNDTGEPVTFDRNLNKNTSVFIPLCGKTKDVRFFVDVGFRVFGIEGVEKVLDQLNQEDSLGMEKKKMDDGSILYQTTDGQCTIFCGDIFKCPIETWGPFDLIWDRGSLIAVDYDMRRPYIDLMKRSVKTPTGNYNDFRYLLETVNYDKTKYAGPPRAVDDDDLKEFYADWVDYKVLDSTPLSEMHQIRKIPDIGEVHHSFNYIMTPRKTQQPVSQA